MWKVASGNQRIYRQLDAVAEGHELGSAQRRARARKSAGVIGEVEFSAPEYNPIKIIGLLRAARRLSRNPEGAVLADVLPPDFYARYRPCTLATHRATGAASNAARSRRAAPLRRGARCRGPHHDGRRVSRTIRQLVRRADVPTTRLKFVLEPQDVIADLQEITPAAELTCFATALASIETDLDAMQARGTRGRWATSKRCGVSTTPTRRAIAWRCSSRQRVSTSSRARVRAVARRGGKCARGARDGVRGLADARAFRGRWAARAARGQGLRRHGALKATPKLGLLSAPAASASALDE